MFCEFVCDALGVIFGLYILNLAIEMLFGIDIIQSLVEFAYKKCYGIKDENPKDSKKTD